MAAFVLTDAVVWIGPYAMQGLTNSTALSLQADAQETTPFGATSRTRAPGLKGVGMQIEGNWDPAVDLGFQGALLAASHPVTIAQLSTLGTPAFLFKAITADYKIGGAIGDVAKFSAGERHAQCHRERHRTAARRAVCDAKAVRVFTCVRGVGRPDARRYDRERRQLGLQLADDAGDAHSDHGRRRRVDRDRGADHGRLVALQIYHRRHNAVIFHRWRDGHRLILGGISQAC